MQRENGLPTALSCGVLGSSLCLLSLLAGGWRQQHASVARDVTATVGLSDPTGDDYAQLRNRIRDLPITLSPEHAYPGIVDGKRLAQAIVSLAPSWDTFKIYKALHALELWGAEAEFTYNDAAGFVDGYAAGTTAELLDLMLSDDLHSSAVPIEIPILFRASTGVGVRLSPSEVGMEGGISHADALLSVLAECGVASGRPVTVGGEQRDVKSLISYSMLEIDNGQELEWTLNALSRYLLPRIPEWTDIHSRTRSLNGLTQALVKQGVGRGSCYGTHVPYSLAVVYRLDSSNGFLTAETRHSVYEYLMEVKESLQTTQTPRGSWPKMWHPAVETVPIESKPNMPSFQQTEFQEIMSTGHHLDWIAIAPQEFHPDEASLKLAADYALGEIERLSSSKIAFFYIQLTHAARGLALLNGDQPVDLLRSTAANQASLNEVR